MLLTVDVPDDLMPRLTDAAGSPARLFAVNDDAPVRLLTAMIEAAVAQAQQLTDERNADEDGRAGWNDLSVVASALRRPARKALLILDECGTACTSNATTRVGERGGTSRENTDRWTVSWQAANVLAQERLVVEHTGRNEGDTKRRQVTITDRGRAVAHLLKSEE